MSKAVLTSHLKKMSKAGMRPNFFVSVPYLRFFQAKVIKRNNAEWLEADGQILFPPVIQVRGPAYPVDEIWSDFENKKPWGTNWILSPLDWEYLYNPQDFNFMNGGKWNTFRKNVRKWPRVNTGWKYVEDAEDVQIQSLLGYWLEKRQETVQDAEFIIHCVLDQPEGVYLRYLIDGEGVLAAINVFDDNYAFINYRFLICRDDPYLDEFARFLFYRDDLIQLSGKLVNDGGTLENPGLERFKDKLNPVCKRMVHSWRTDKTNF